MAQHARRTVSDRNIKTTGLTLPRALYACPCLSEGWVYETRKLWDFFLVGEGQEKQPYSKQVDWKLRWTGKSARAPNVCIRLDSPPPTAQQKGSLGLPFYSPYSGLPGSYSFPYAQSILTYHIFS